MKYTTPVYEVELVEVNDIMVNSVCIYGSNGDVAGILSESEDGNTVNMTVDVGKAFML